MLHINLLINLFTYCFNIVDLSEAVAYCQRRRNIPPALYNPSKLRQSRRQRRRHPHTVDLTTPATTSVAETTPGSENRFQDNFLGNLQSLGFLLSK